MPRRPEEKDFKAARDYLVLRLQAEASMSRNLERIFKEAAQKLVLICYKYNVTPQQLLKNILPYKMKMEITQVIDWLKETIEDYFDSLVLAAPDSDRDFILPWIKSKRYGQTFEERLEGYMDKFRFEIYLLTAAGLMIGFGSVPLINSIWRNIHNPWSNPDLQESLIEKPSYGVGKSNAMFNALNNLTKNGIALAWMKTKAEKERKDGAYCWWVERGSSYPCDICDSMTGFHYDDSYLPLYHTSCCCIAVPIYPKLK